MPRYRGRHRNSRRFPPLATSSLSVLVVGSGLSLLLVTSSTDPEQPHPPRTHSTPAAPTHSSPTVRPYVKEFKAPSSSLPRTLALAKAQVGISGVPNKFTIWYSAEKGSSLRTAPWCAIFLAWLADRTGTSAPDHAYTPTMAEQFVKQGRWGTKPKLGAYVFYDWGGSKSRAAIDHVGLVVKIHSDGSITTIEGNSSNRVVQHRRVSHIVGYGYPNYYPSRG